MALLLSGCDVTYDATSANFENGEGVYNCTNLIDKRVVSFRTDGLKYRSGTSGLALLFEDIKTGMPFVMRPEDGWECVAPDGTIQR